MKVSSKCFNNCLIIYMYILDITYSSDDILSGPLSMNGSFHETNTAHCNSIKIVLYHVARHEGFF